MYVLKKNSNYNMIREGYNDESRAFYTDRDMTDSECKF